MGLHRDAVLVLYRGPDAACFGTVLAVETSQNGRHSGITVVTSRSRQLTPSRPSSCEKSRPEIRRHHSIGLLGAIVALHLPARCEIVAMRGALGPHFAENSLFTHIAKDQPRIRIDILLLEVRDCDIRSG